MHQIFLGYYKKTLRNENCVAVNTLGYLKKDMGELSISPYFGKSDGIYLKKTTKK